jgi:DNA-binding PadR family transcriptional regulator
VASARIFSFHAYCGYWESCDCSDAERSPVCRLNGARRRRCGLLVHNSGGLASAEPFAHCRRCGRWRVYAGRLLTAANGSAVQPRAGCTVGLAASRPRHWAPVDGLERQGDGRPCGFSVAARIEQVSSGAIPLNMETLYPGLLRLEQRGFVYAQWDTTETNRRATFYDIRTSGRAWWRLCKRYCRRGQNSRLGAEWMYRLRGTFAGSKSLEDETHFHVAPVGLPAREACLSAGALQSFLKGLAISKDRLAEPSSAR